MRAIWKFKLEPGVTVIELPKTTGRHHFLHAGIDPLDGNPAMWVHVHKLDPSNPNYAILGDETNTYKVLTLPTGEISKEDEYVEDCRYLGTVHQHAAEQDVFEADYVWHVFVQPGYHKVGHGR